MPLNIVDIKVCPNFVSSELIYIFPNFKWKCVLQEHTMIKYKLSIIKQILHSIVAGMLGERNDAL